MSKTIEVWLTETDADRLRNNGLYVELIGTYKVNTATNVTYWKYVMYTSEYTKVKLYLNANSYAGMTLEEFLGAVK